MKQHRKIQSPSILLSASIRFIFIVTLLLTGCRGQAPQPVPTQPIPPTPIPSLTPVPPSPSPLASTPTLLPEPTKAPAATDPTWERIQSAGKIVAAISADYPPFSYIDENFAITGYDVALVQELSRRLDIPMDIRNMAFDGLVDALILGQIDMAVAAISVTPERDALIDFSSVYYVGDDAILANKDSSITVQTVQDLAAYRLGVQTGSVYETWLSETLVKPGLMPPQSLVTFQTPQEAVDALAGPNPQVDLVVMDNLPAQDAALKSPVKIVAQSLNQQLYAIAIPQGSTTLQAKLNEALTQMQNDGTLAALAKQWLKVEALPPAPTPAPTQAPATPSACQNGMAFEQDLSYPDNQMRNPALVAPGTLVQKGWRIRNTGNCTWDNRYVLAYVGSAPANALVGGNPVALQGQVAPGQTYDVYAEIVAPMQSGLYQSFWSLRDETGSYFGDRLYAGFQVLRDAPSTPLPQRPAIYYFTVTPSQIGQGQCVLLNWSFGGQDLTYARLFRGNQLLLQNIPLNNSYTDCPPGVGPLTYSLVVDSRFGGSTSAVQPIYIYPLIGPTVTSAPTLMPPPVINYFAADRNQVNLGECITLSWSVTGVAGTKIRLLRRKDVIASDLGSSGSLQDCPLTPGAVDYYLIAETEDGGSVTQSLYITILAPLTYQPFSPIQGSALGIVDFWKIR
jgi:polar amino acid transport system substrate-binding protein